METTSYTTDGPVRGTCNHAHKTLETALACLRRDRRGCKKQGGYSDRRVVRLEDGRMCGRGAGAGRDSDTRG